MNLFIGSSEQASISDTTKSKPLVPIPGFIEKSGRSFSVNTTSGHELFRPGKSQGSNCYDAATALARLIPFDLDTLSRPVAESHGSSPCLSHNVRVPDQQDRTR